MVENKDEKNLGIYNVLADWFKFKRELKKSFDKFINISLGIAAFLYFLDLIGELELFYIPLIPILAEPIKIILLLSYIPPLALCYVIYKVISKKPNPLDKMIEKTEELNKKGYKVTTSKLLKADYLTITTSEKKTFFTDKNTMIVKTKKGETLTITEKLEYLNRYRKELVSTNYKLEPKNIKIKNKSLY